VSDGNILFGGIHIVDGCPQGLCRGSGCCGWRVGRIGEHPAPAIVHKPAPGPAAEHPPAAIIANHAQLRDLEQELILCELSPDQSLFELTVALFRLGE
jgi:hypothetical protein